MIDFDEGQQNLFGDEPMNENSETGKIEEEGQFESYEEGVTKLEEILQKIQDEELSLEENVKLYEKGMHLHKKLLEFLEEQELRVHNMKDHKENPLDDGF